MKQRVMLISLKVTPTQWSGVYNCGGYQIRHSDTGGKAGRNRNKTATLQVTETCNSGYLILKMFSFVVGDKKSYDNAERKCVEWIQHNPLEKV
jgi:hypothetical protein